MIAKDVDPRTRVDQILAEFHDPTLNAAVQFCDRHNSQSIAFTFIRDDGTGSDMTFGELAERSRRVATVLAERGVGPGSRVATLMGKGPDLPAVILGAWRLGAVYAPLFTAFASDAITDRLTRAEATVVVTDETQRHKITDGSWSVLVSGDKESAESLSLALDKAEPSEISVDGGPQVPLVHMFTSGTTGKPKAVVHPKIYAAGWQGYLEFGLGVRGAEANYWCSADPGWAYGLYSAIIAPLATGTRSLMTTGPFDPAKTWEVLEAFEVTDFAAAPTALRAMRAARESMDLPHLQRLSSAGEPLTPDVLEWTRTLGVPVHDHFGQTEVGMPAGFPHHPSIEIATLPKSMGHSFPGWNVKVIGLEHDETVKTGETGRLAIHIESSPFFTFTGYGTARDYRSDRFTSDGEWYLTGDLATIDDQGVLHFASRDDDVILMAGYRIGPFEIESALLGHPVVSEAAVVAAPDEIRGEIAHAFVVLAEGHASEPELVNTLQQWVKSNYAAHAYPRRIDFVEALPKTESGKVKRADLRNRLTTPN